MFSVWVRLSIFAFVQGSFAFYFHVNFLNWQLISLETWFRFSWLYKLWNRSLLLSWATPLHRPDTGHAWGPAHMVLMLIRGSWATNPTPTLFCIHSWATSFLKKIHKNNLMGCAHSINKKAISIVTTKYCFQRRSWISVFVFCSSRVQLLL